MRKLAAIRKIDGIIPIEGADKIETAAVGGWKVVCKKGEFKPGDLAVYCEIDSWIPHAIAPFLSEGEPKEYNQVKGARLRTVRMRGQTSQGLLLPLDVLPKDILDSGKAVGTDVTEILGIQLWEPPMDGSVAGDQKGAFPWYVQKTDEERIQNLADSFEKLKKLTWNVTEKVDGTSFTAFVFEGQFGVCSRNFELKDTAANFHWTASKKLRLEEAMKTYSAGNFDFAVQGELIGEKIQGNCYGIKGQKLLVFNIYNISEGLFLSWENVEKLCEELKIETVPLVHSTYTIPSEYTMDSLIQFADGPSALCNKRREGLVFKDAGRTNSFKIISNKYLEKQRDNA
ncbi:MAG: RNA ligase (ATP) [Spirochaeta sp. LUC14_002_19_P3]|nr:MAG: RNA ligase (ATP) [Spirochaeta sp. LUC14_002_19_P3]